MRGVALERALKNTNGNGVNGCTEEVHEFLGANVKELLSSTYTSG